MSAQVVHVSVRMSGGTYLAQAGKGKQAKRASCTMGPEHAARACAAKCFGVTRTLGLQLKTVGEGQYEIAQAALEGGDA